MFKYKQKTINAIIVDYENGYLFQIDYLSDQELKFTSLKPRTDGGPMTETETYFSKELADGLIFVNWIEEAGVVVSQILDFNKMEVETFMTWEQADARGKRGYLVNHGQIRFPEE